MAKEKETKKEIKRVKVIIETKDPVLEKQGHFFVRLNDYEATIMFGKEVEIPENVVEYLKNIVVKEAISETTDKGTITKFHDKKMFIIQKV